MGDSISKKKKKTLSDVNDDGVMDGPPAVGLMFAGGVLCVTHHIITQMGRGGQTSLRARLP